MCFRVECVLVAPLNRQVAARSPKIQYTNPAVQIERKWVLIKQIVAIYSSEVIHYIWGQITQIFYGTHFLLICFLKQQSECNCPLNCSSCWNCFVTGLSIQHLFCCYIWTYLPSWTLSWMSHDCHLRSSALFYEVLKEEGEGVIVIVVVLSTIGLFFS